MTDKLIKTYTAEVVEQFKTVRTAQAAALQDQLEREQDKLAELKIKQQVRSNERVPND